MHTAAEGFVGLGSIGFFAVLEFYGGMSYEGFLVEGLWGLWG